MHFSISIPEGFRICDFRHIADDTWHVTMKEVLPNESWIYHWGVGPTPQAAIDASLAKGRNFRTWTRPKKLSTEDALRELGL